MSVRKTALAFAFLLLLVLGMGNPGALAHTEDKSPALHEEHEKSDLHSGRGGGGLSLGATVYKHMCAFCHGEDGNGGGKAIAYLFPWPRDFRKGVFKFRSTPSGSLPLDSDIYRTISRGVPGTAMPSWEHALSDEETLSVVQYIKSFSKRFQEEKPKPGIEPGVVPETNPGAMESGEKLYQEMRCARCHGTDLKGEGEQADQLYDIWDHRIFVYDLTDPSTYKSGWDKKSIYMTLTTGLDGTPMKSFQHLTDKERWDLASFVESKIAAKKYEEARHESDLTAGRIDGDINLEPNDPLWNDVPSREVRLIPLNARRSPVNRIKVQVVVNDEAAAFRLEWEDPIPDRTSSRHQDFKDAVAVEFALGDVLLHTHGHNEPFFGMGNRGKVVNIWQWRADWQTEIETKEKLEYATKGLDLDTMIFGGEVNPVDSLNPFRDVPVEEMNAEGFGTLTPQPRTKQNVLGKGVWKDGKWSVVLYRTLESLNKWDSEFTSKQPILVAFAVWDGANQDRNGRKVVSMWQRLFLPWTVKSVK